MVLHSTQIWLNQQRTVLFMKLLDLEDISALLNDIKIELIPPSKCCKLWSRDVGQGMEVESTYSSSDGQQP